MHMQFNPSNVCAGLTLPSITVGFLYDDKETIIDRNSHYQIVMKRRSSKDEYYKNKRINYQHINLQFDFGNIRDKSTY